MAQHQAHSLHLPRSPLKWMLMLLHAQWPQLKLPLRALLQPTALLQHHTKTSKPAITMMSGKG